MKNTYRDIPNFDNNCIYLPKINNGTINDYFNTYKEFSSLIILDEDKEENKFKIINILESFKILKEDILITKSHDVHIKQKPFIKNFKEEYLTILNYVKENYIQKRPLVNNFFYLKYNFKENKIYLKEIINPEFSNLSISFDLGYSNYIKIQKEPLGNNFFYLKYNFKNKKIYLKETINPVFSNLSISFNLGYSNYINLNDSFFNYLLKNSNNDYEIDKEKIIGYQRTKENLKYF